MSNAITIHDIAREANVSPSTVSRVLNGNVPVAPDKRAAVLAVIKQLNYQPNAIARGLVRRRTAAVGVMTQSIASPFYGEILVGIEKGFSGSGYHAIFTSGNWRTAEELAALDRLSAAACRDALILLTGGLPDEHLLRVAKELPLVVIGRSIAEIEDRCIRGSERFQAAYEATRYLIALGHRRIAHIAGPASHQDTVDRRAGYQAALNDSDLVVDEQLIVEGDYTEQSGLLAMQALLSRGEMFSGGFRGERPDGLWRAAGAVSQWHSRARRCVDCRLR